MGAGGRFEDAPGRARDGSGTPREGPGTDLGVSGAEQVRLGTGQKLSRAGPGSDSRARLVRRALSNTLAEQICVVFVVSLKSSKRKIRAPTQCFVSLGQCMHRPRASVEKPRKSIRFGLQNRAREHPGDPKSGASGPDRAKMHARSASGASENLKVGASEQLRARKRERERPRRADPRRAPQC